MRKLAVQVLLLVCFVFAVRGRESRVVDASIIPFEIQVPDVVLEDLKLRLDRTRWPDQLTDVNDWTMGAEKGFMKAVAKYWQEKFDWRAQEKRLNSFPQFMTNIDGINLHFIHAKAKSRTADAAVLMLHGWPGSFLECTKVIPLLTDPSNHSEPAFDVICPSLPGYGFSSAPTHRGFDHRRMADVFDLLMMRLGYSQFIVQGGDWGSTIGTWLAARSDPRRIIGLHLNFVAVSMPLHKGLWPMVKSMSNMLIPRRFNPWARSEETSQVDTVSDSLRWMWADGAYMHLHATKPQTVSYALSDSPIGLAAWMLEKFYGWSDNDGSLLNVFTMDELLTNVMIYWSTNSIGSSIRLYYEFFSSNPFSSESDFYVRQPTALSVFPKEILKPPRHMIDYYYNIVQYRAHEKGGHFAALEQPEALVADLRNLTHRLMQLHIPKLPDREEHDL